MPADYTEDALIERPAIAVFHSLGWDWANCFHEFEGGPDQGRETSADVVLVRRLRAALRRLNPATPPEAIDLAVLELSRDRSNMGAKSSTAPVTARVFHSSDASPQPYSPGWSVSTLTNTQLRISAFTTTVLIAVIFIRLSPQMTLRTQRGLENNFAHGSPFARG
jgi:type I restriction enzyme R subunit